MSRVTIKGTELPLQKIFSSDYAFSIPYYQRPYAWTAEQAEELLDDFIMAMGSTNSSIDEMNPYFLGSIVLVKGDGRDAEIVDGQQRLTTLTVLFAAMRDFFDGEYREGMTNLLYEKGNPITMTETRYRLRLRDRDDEFFRDFILSEDGLEKLKDLHDVIPDSQALLRKNTLYYHERLSQLTDEERKRLATFITTRCYIVVVSTPDFDSAYRIFSVLNDRGLELSHSDILKAEIIGRIKGTDLHNYTHAWEEAEQNLGRENFQDLFAHIRMISVKARQKKTILEEIRERIKPADDPRGFIDEVLLPSAEAFDDLLTESYASSSHSDSINEYIRLLHLIDNTDWMPPAIAYISRHRQNPAAILKFLKHLERLAMVFMLLRKNLNRRVERFGKLLRTMEDDEQDLYGPDSPLQLTAGEKNEAIDALGGDIYELVVRRPLLLRLDHALSAGGATYDHKIITIEHVLPQNPKPDSEWLSAFPDEEERVFWTNKLANLVLLTRRKNSQASNFDFSKKKDQYFSRDGTSPFVLTTQVLQEEDWTPTVLERRQKSLIKKFSDLWEFR